MSDLDLNKIIEVLRDTAAKTVETETKPSTLHGAKNFYMEHGGMCSEEPPTETVSKYDRNWLAGRMEGLADGIEFLTQGKNK
ncbi:hypothetical protein JY97_00585 [Alkalispirochaeta odontotermitis]|nr:hypothetical protein JY97_00585 [Alkalispirochaeta odontotermitis]